jgi:DNA-binding NarL/FixJ family response regulator
MPDHRDPPTTKLEAVHTIQSHPQGALRPMGKVVALMNDLFFQMKVLETAKYVGVDFKVAATPDAFFAALESSPKLVIIDLNAAGDPIGVIQKLRAAKNEVRVVAFLSHVQRDLAAQAQAAGCSEVLPRSAFTQNLAAILSTAKD